ncbi:hypothetical protein Q3G72_034768 [Acer saccharum]|nr:hypothetical protein Q3G72_034768 [Acer saccharum]
MNADEVARLCASMSLKDREGPVRSLQTGLKDAGLKRLANSLVGKVLTTKTVHRDGFRVVLRKIWQTREGVEIEPIIGNIFAFHFNNLDDKRRIMARGPWSFNDALIVMVEPEGKGDVQHMNFNKTEFWIQIHNAPLICMTEEIGRFLGSIVGEVVDFDTGDPGSNMTKYIRVRVILEIDKPLRRCLRVDVLGDGVESVMLVKYERLPEFCFRCGLLGHMTKDCPDKPLHSGEAKEEELLFGYWMRAAAPARRYGTGGRRWLNEGKGSFSGYQGRGRENRDWRTNADVEYRDSSGRNGDLKVEGGDQSRQRPNLVSTIPCMNTEESTEFGRQADFEGILNSSTIAGLEGLYVTENQAISNERERGEINVKSTIVAFPNCDMVGGSLCTGPLGKMGLVERAELGKGPELTNGPTGPRDPVEEIDVNTKKAQQLPINIAAGPVEFGDKGVSQLVLCAQNSQIDETKSTTTGTWKRRARNQHRVGNQSHASPLLGKKQKGSGSGIGKGSETLKKQRFVSSNEDSTDAGTSEGSVGRFSPASRVQ